MQNPSSGPEQARSEIQWDLGFGAKVARDARGRLLNHDGSFNVSRKRLSFFRSRTLFHNFITMGWWKFHAIILSAYLLLVLMFAIAFYLCGPDALVGAVGRSATERFTDALFFSLQTSTTLGSSRVAAQGVAANVLVSVEPMLGLLGFALATSLMFARFSRPDTRILFSNRAVVAPYRGITALEFRVINERSNQLIQLEVKVILSVLEGGPRGKVRRFHRLKLERDSVVFFPLNWTIVHPIDNESPLFGLDEASFTSRQPEMLILLTAIDDTFSQTVHARSSYTSGEIVWNARFSTMFTEQDGQQISVDLRRIHDIEAAELIPAPPGAGS